MGEKVFLPDMDDVSDIGRWCLNKIFAAKDGTHGIMIVDAVGQAVEYYDIKLDGTLGVQLQRMPFERMSNYHCGLLPGSTFESKGDVFYCEIAGNGHGRQNQFHSTFSFNRRTIPDEMEYRKAVLFPKTTPLSKALANFEDGVSIGHALSKNIAVILEVPGTSEGRAVGHVSFLHKNKRVGMLTPQGPQLYKGQQFLLERIKFLCKQ